MFIGVNLGLLGLRVQRPAPRVGGPLIGERNLTKDSQLGLVSTSHSPDGRDVLHTRQRLTDYHLPLARFERSLNYHEHAHTNT